MGVAKTISKDILYFFTYKQYAQSNPLAIILNRRNVREYIHHIQNTLRYAGTTTATKLSRLKTAIDFLLEGAPETNIKLYIRAQNMLKTIKYFRKSLSKTITEQRLHQAQLSHAEVGI